MSDHAVTAWGQAIRGHEMNALLQALVNGTPSEGVQPGSFLAPKAQTIQKLRYTHEAMIDILIAEPWVSQNELADRFGMSASWVSTIICSDLFQSQLAERRDQLVDPELRLSIKTQMEGLHARSMEILRHKLNRLPDDVPDQLALQVAKVMSQGLGMGAPKVSISETHVHLEELGQNLVGLLRRRKAETYDHEETQHEGHPQQRPNPPAGEPGP
jgi:hypothetical protein